MIISFQEQNENFNQNILNNIIHLIQNDQQQKYSIKEIGNKIKLYINNIQNINESIQIINQIHS